MNLQETEPTGIRESELYGFLLPPLIRLYVYNHAVKHVLVLESCF